METVVGSLTSTSLKKLRCHKRDAFPTNVHRKLESENGKVLMGTSLEKLRSHMRDMFFHKCKLESPSRIKSQHWKPWQAFVGFETVYGVCDMGQNDPWSIIY